MAISLSDNFKSFAHEKYFSEHVSGLNKKYLDSLPEKCLKLAVIPPDEYMDVKSKMDYTSCIIVVGSIVEVAKERKIKNKTIGIYPTNKDGIKTLQSVNAIPKNIDLLNFEYTLNPSPLDLIIKPLIDKYYDDLDNIYFGCYKDILFDLYIYLRSKNFKVLMPLEKENCESVKNSNQDKLIYNAKNKYEPQQKLF